MRQRLLLMLLTVAIGTAGFGCSNSDSEDLFWLHLMHASDLEGGVDAVQDAPNFAAVVEALERDAAANGYASILLSAGDSYLPGPFFSAAGDSSLRGTLQATYQEFFGDPGLDNIREGNGRADITIMNLIGFDASALGNHEFDSGTDLMEDLIGTDIRGATSGDVRWLGAQFPYLSANLDFSASNLDGLYTDQLLANTAFKSEPSDLAAAGAAPKFAPFTFIRLGDEFVGVVGATTPRLGSVSSPGEVVVEGPGAGTDDMAALAQVLQPSIDALVNSGINKVVLVTHLQNINLERDLAPRLRGVDIIVAGGSDTILTDASDRLRVGDVSQGTYPIQTVNADGEPALIVSTDGEYKYVGRLVVGFDRKGILEVDSLDNLQSGAFPTDDQGVNDVWAGGDPFAAGTKGAAVKIITDAVQDVVAAKDGNITGQTSLFIEGRREFVRTQQTNFGDLSADANLWFARQFDPSVMVSIKNGGGIRAEIGEVGSNGELLPPQANPISGKLEGEISQLDIENSLRFNNGLSLITLTVTELKEVLEHGIGFDELGVAQEGRFPDVGGVRMSFDPGLTAGSRILTLALIDDSGVVIDEIVTGGTIVGDANREIRVVTLNFLANGGDAYQFPFPSTNRVDLVGEAANFNAPDQDANGNGTVDGAPAGLPVGDFTFADPGSEQDALAEYLSKFYGEAPFETADTTRLLDDRLQFLNEPGKTDTVLDLPTPALGLVFQSTITLGDAEILTFAPDADRFFVTSGDTVRIVAVDAALLLTHVGTITPANDLTGFTVGGINSAAYKGGILAVAVQADPQTDAGRIAFYDNTGNFLGDAGAGALPDMVTFDHSGTTVLAANEGEPDGGIDPDGSITVVRLGTGTPVQRVAGATVDQVGFGSFIGQEDTLRADGVRIFPGMDAAEDFEPEYIAVAPDDQTAWVALQEANSVAVLDLSANPPIVTEILALGSKDHMMAGYGLDSSDRDSGINIRNRPVMGMFMPDAIATFETGGKTFLLSANEGDARSEDDRIKNLTLDPVAFPDGATLQQDEVLGRLQVSTIDGDTDGDGDYDVLYSYGARSFSVWDTDSGLVFDSGDDIGRITARVVPTLFNADDGLPSEFDSRSDNKGGEAEAVTSGVVNGRVYAFVGLERTAGGVLIYDVTNPAKPIFQSYTPGVSDDGNAANDDISVEGLIFIAAADSPNGSPLIVTANEVSGTLVVYQIIQ